MVDHLQKITLISLIILTLLTGASASDWEFQTPGEPYNSNYVSINTSNVFITELQTHEGEEITPEYIENFDEEGEDTESSPYVAYELETLNETSGDPITVNRSLSYNNEIGAWVAEFEPDYDGMTQIEFKAKGDSSEDGGIDSNGEATSVEEVMVSDTNINLLEENLEVDLSQPLKAGTQEKFDVRTLNITDGDQPIGEDDIDVDLHFYNASEIDNTYSVNNYNDDSLDEGGQYHFNSEVNFPDETGSTYVLRIESTTAENEESSYATIIETSEAIEGELRELNSDGCSDEEDGLEDILLGSINCEPEADINTTFDIVNADAEQVNMTLYGVNKSTGNTENIGGSMEMDEVEALEGAEQTFESNIQIPDINTSEFEKGLELEFHAWNDQRSYSENHSIDLTSFTVQDRSNPATSKGVTHEIRLLFGKMFSLDPYDQSRFNEINVSLESPESDFNDSFVQEDLEFIESEGVMTTDVVIPQDEDSGTYTLSTTATNIYGEEKQFSSSLNVRELDASFAAQDSLELQYNSLGEFNESLALENLVDSNKTIQIRSDLDVISAPDEVTLEPEEQREVDLEVSLTSAQDYDGEIEFTDNETNYNESTSITINSPNCAVTDNNLCLDQGSLDFSANSQETITRTIGLINLADETMDVQTGLTGNISDHVSVESNINLTSSETLELSFDTPTPGNYTGNLIMSSNDSEVSANLTAEADFEASNPELSVSPTSIDLGTLPEGESTSETVTIGNTGNTEVENIEAVGDYSFDIESFSLSPGDEESIELSFDSYSGSTISFVGQSDEDDVSAQLAVQGEVIEDYSDRTNEIENRVNELQGQTDDSELNTRLTEVSGMVDRVNSQWDQGEHEDARTTFEDAQEELDRIEVDIQTQASESGGSDQQEAGGGLPIIPIVMILLVLSVVGGFVFYESYIPEEGDPLYGVMG